MYFVIPSCIFRPTFRLSEFRLFKCFSICFVFSVEKSNIVNKPEVSKVFSIDIDSFRDVCSLKDFFHNSSK